MKKRAAIVFVLLLLFLSAHLGQAQDAGIEEIAPASSLNGGGATFPKPLYDILFASTGSQYNATGSVTLVNYQGIGSSGGINGIIDNSLDFGATDAPMNDDQLAEASQNGKNGSPVLHIPTAVGGVSITYNIPGLEDNGPIQLTAENLALIFLGDSEATTTAFGGQEGFAPLVKWNDPRLTVNNKALEGVDKYITVVHRAEGSGTSNILTSYLSAVSPEWEEQIGAGNLVDWPTGIGAKSNAGVAANIQQTPYSIGYVEEGYALTSGLPSASIQNKDGVFVQPAQLNVSAAAAGIELPDDLRLKIVNAAGQDAYPISGFTWVLLRQEQPDPSKAVALVDLFRWVITDGQAVIVSAGAVTDPADPLFALSGYAPLPPAAQEKAVLLLKSITTPIDGVETQVWTE